MLLKKSSKNGPIENETKMVKNRIKKYYEEESIIMTKNEIKVL